MIKEAIHVLAEEHQNLSTEQTEEVVGQILDGVATPGQTTAFLAALRAKGETADEILGCVRAMRQRAPRVNCNGIAAVDIGGTGGDRSGTFNISTTAAFVVAAAGLPVAKHGNRHFSSQAGSADLIEALGIKLQLSPDRVGACLGEVGMAFLFTPAFYPAPPNLSQLRREIGIRSIFNLAGPVANPANVACQTVGVAQPGLTEVLARVLARLGKRHVLIFFGLDGLDEISICAKTKISELKEGKIRTFYLEAETLGLQHARLEDIRGGTAKENARICLDVLSGKKGPPRDIVLLSAAAALIAGDRVTDFSTGLTLAKEAIDSGRACQILERLRDFNHHES